MRDVKRRRNQRLHPASYLSNRVVGGDHLLREDSLRRAEVFSMSYFAMFLQTPSRNVK